MSEFIGARISLISRSDIRYVGTLHEINSDESTVSLENVRSFGTEGRKAQDGKPAEEVAPSDELYEYIIFRGTDVKDLRIEETPAAVKENKPPVMPNDPAIVGARARPGPPAAGPPGPPGPSGFQQGPPNPGPIGAHNQQGPPPYFPPPHMGGWGRAQGPGPEAFGNMQYPPPPQGWFPPGQQYPPMGPGPWNNYPFPHGPGVPPGPPGAPGMPGAPGQPGRQSANHTPNNAGQQPKPAPIGPAADKKPSTPAQQQKQTEASTQPKPVAPQAKQPAPATAPVPPVESKPSVEEVKATAAALSNNAPPAGPREALKTIPTGPKSIQSAQSSRPSQILPAVPLPAALTQKVSPRPQTSSSKPAEQATGVAPSLRDATQAAKNAVAVAMAEAMAKMEGRAPVAPPAQPTNGSAVDNLTNKVNEMRVNAPRGGPSNRGRGGRPPRPAKVEVPDSDFDFASANAKFNKQEVVKEAYTGSPLAETHNHGEVATPEAAPESDPVLPSAYNKSRSFFDNISSEAKDRVENNGQKPGGREWRGEEQRRNMETFGQGSVDGGYRGYRGRGRGRGNRGRGYRGGGRGGMPRARETQPATQ
ncbi:Scd6-like Sm domain containing protein [Rhypophila sp. PSN 637]